MIDGESKHKTNLMKGNTALWTESFYLLVYFKTCTSHSVTDFCRSDALRSSLLECRLYVKHNIRNDDFIGGTKDTIELLLAEGAAGGLYIFLLPTFKFANNHPLSVISRELRKYDSCGNQHSTQVVIEFSIVTISQAANADGLNMDEAVTGGKEALGHMKPALSPLEPIQGVTNASANVVNNIKSVSNSWDPFLQKVKLFTELVDTIAEVRDGTHTLHSL